MKGPMNPRRRIVRLFGGGIVLPSLLLGYLAFRGIRNDRALVEKERLEETRRIAERILLTVDDGITAAELALSNFLAGQSGTPAAGGTAALKKPAGGNPLVEQVFSLRDFKDIHFPIARLLYSPDGHRNARPSPAAGPDESAEILKAEQLEFRVKDYPRSLAAYRAALERAQDTPRAGMILNAVARVQRKSGLLKESLSTYEGIVRDHSGDIIPGGLPLGPSACLEICAISRELKDIPKAVRAAMDLFRSLIRPEWALERSEFDFFVERAKSLIEEFLADPPPGIDLAPLRKEFQDLRAEEAERKKTTERIALFEESAAPALQARLEATGNAGSPEHGFVRLTLDSETTPISSRSQGRPSEPATPRMKPGESSSTEIGSGRASSGPPYAINSLLGRSLGPSKGGRGRSCCRPESSLRDRRYSGRISPRTSRIGPWNSIHRPRASSNPSCFRGADSILSFSSSSPASSFSGWS